MYSVHVSFFSLINLANKLIYRITIARNVEQEILKQRVGEGDARAAFLILCTLLFWCFILWPALSHVFLSACAVFRDSSILSSASSIRSPSPSGGAIAPLTAKQRSLIISSMLFASSESDSSNDFTFSLPFNKMQYDIKQWPLFPHSWCVPGPIACHWRNTTILLFQ